MEMFSETGKSLVLCCFCPACRHTFTHTHIHTHTCTHALPQKDGFAAHHYQKCVLYGARCLRKENITMSNHFSSFKAILIFFPDFTIAGTKRV